jgi:MFS family permease
VAETARSDLQAFVKTVIGRDRQVSWTDTFAYALPALSLAVIGIPVYVYLPKFYTDTIGLNIATVGVLLMAVRLFDAVTDPVIGYVSDRTSGRFGRRKPYIALGALGLAAAILFLFQPPVLTDGAMTLYFGFWLFALFFFWTLITIPYESLGPEMTTDYHERTLLFSVRDGFLILGTLMAAATPVLIDAVMTSFGRTPTEKERLDPVNGHQHRRFQRCFFSGPGRCRNLRGAGLSVRHRVRGRACPAVRHPGRCDRL